MDETQFENDEEVLAALAAAVPKVRPLPPISATGPRDLIERMEPLKTPVLVLPLILTAVGVLLGLLAMSQALRADEVSRVAATGSLRREAGVVVSKLSVPSQNADTLSHEVTYRWGDPTRPQLSTDVVNELLYDSLSVGQDVEVSIWTLDRRTLVRLSANKPDGPFIWYIIIAGIGVTTVGYWAVLYPLTLAAEGRERELVANGHATVGRITGVEPGPEGEKQWLYYEFTTAAGLTQRGSAAVDDAGNLPKAGDPISIFYDPVRPRRSLLYRYSRYAVLR